MLTTPTPLFMSIMGFNYLMCINVLQDHMKHKEAYNLQQAMVAYNIFQIVFNGYICYGLYTLVSLDNPFGLNTPYSQHIEHFVFLHYISKYLDYLDTVFIILRKKTSQLSTLHIYHHATIPIVWGSLLYIGHGNGTAAFGCLINSFIHIIMYSHYLCTGLGFRNPLKKYITQAQMGQFVCCLAHAGTVYAYETVVPSYLALTQFIYHVQMLYLFNRFYSKTY